LLSKPDKLILDEPLAYLDIISQQIVLRQLRQLARNRARPIGVIITSQQLYEIEMIADRLLVLDGGNTMFSGRVSDLSKLINDLVVEFNSTGEMTAIKGS
jgi:ABC-2 type transport system ATP-binding protein